MKTIRNMIGVLSGSDALRSPAARARVRRDPMCETLEGRQLLSTAASTLASDMPVWVSRGGFPGGSHGAPTTAEIAHFRADGGHKGKGPTDFAHAGKSGSFTPPAMSATLQADFTTLQNDEKQLQSEIPTSVSSAVTADQAVVAKALGFPAPPAQGGIAMAAPIAVSTPSSGGMTTMLEKAGISTAQATQIASDFQTYQTDLQTIDPTLQAKIAADQAAIAKDGGPTLPPGGAGMVVVGRPMTGMPPT